VEKKERAVAAASRESAAIMAMNPSAANSRDADKPQTPKPRKLSYKEARELEGMEERILTTEQEIAGIESLFATPDFHRLHGTRTEQLTADLAAARQALAGLYARWEALEKIRLASTSPPAD
jgi:ATP-binding cassette subfamily F protein uup